MSEVPSSRSLLWRLLIGSSASQGKYPEFVYVTVSLFFHNPWCVAKAVQKVQMFVILPQLNRPCYIARRCFCLLENRSLVVKRSQIVRMAQVLILHLLLGKTKAILVNLVCTQELQKIQPSSFMAIHAARPDWYWTPWRIILTGLGPSNTGGLPIPCILDTWFQMATQSLPRMFDGHCIGVPKQVLASLLAEAWWLDQNDSNERSW